MKTLEQITTMLQSVERYCTNTLGHSRASSPELRIMSDGEWNISIYLYDDFQEPFSRDCVQCGFVTIPLSPDCEPQLGVLLSREQRELAVLVARMGQTAELAREMTSAAGRRYLQTLRDQMSEYLLLLPPAQANSAANIVRSIPVEEV